MFHIQNILVKQFSAFIVSNSVPFEYKAHIKVLFEPLAQLTPKYVTHVTSQLYIFLKKYILYISIPYFDISCNL